MMRFLYINIITAAIGLLALLAGCESEPQPVVADAPIVVEGWIEEGETPVVIVTRAVDLTQNVDSFDGFVQRWCRVSVFDGERKHILEGRVDTAYMPSFVFKSRSLRGEAGHTYRLMIETDTDTIESVSTISPAPEIESLTPEPSAEADTLFTVRAFFRGIDPEGYYKVYARSQREEKRYYGSFLGTFAGADYDPEKGISVSRGIHSTYRDEEFTHFYRRGDFVYVKICRIDRAAYDFWHAYDSAVSMSTNMFFTVTQNCPSNVIGALGCWSACGMNFALVYID